MVEEDYVKGVFRGKGMKSTDTLTPEQLNKLIKYLEIQIPSMPDIRGRTVTYDHDSENRIISLMWDSGYSVSEDHGLYIVVYDPNGRMIGIEILDFEIGVIEDGSRM